MNDFILSIRDLLNSMLDYRDANNVKKEWNDNAEKMAEYKEMGIDSFSFVCRHKTDGDFRYDDELVYEYMAMEAGYELYDEELYGDKTIFHFRAITQGKEGVT